MTTELTGSGSVVDPVDLPHLLWLLSCVRMCQSGCLHSWVFTDSDCWCWSGWFFLSWVWLVVNHWMECVLCVIWFRRQSTWFWVDEWWAS